MLPSLFVNYGKLRQGTLICIRMDEYPYINAAKRRQSEHACLIFLALLGKCE